MGYLDKALETMEKQGGMVINHDRIDRTLQEIGETYRPGLLAWLQQDRGRWSHLLALESRINEIACSKLDETILQDALSDYREFFESRRQRRIRKAIASRKRMLKKGGML